jgi:hypothetical protein
MITTAAALVLEREALAGRAQVGAPRGPRVLEELEHLAQVPAAALRAQRAVERRREGAEPDAVHVHEADVAQRRRAAQRVAQLVRPAVVHGHRRVDQQVDVLVLLLHEQLDHELVEARVDRPVEEAQVVAGRVGPVVGELDRAAALLAALLALHAPLEDLARGDVEPRDAGEDRLVEERPRLLGEGPRLIERRLGHEVTAPSPGAASRCAVAAPGS